MIPAEAPVCVVKRFRRNVPTAPATPHAAEPIPCSSSGSFELVTQDAASHEVTF